VCPADPVFEVELILPLLHHATMNQRFRLLLTLLLLGCAARLSAQGTAFTYQGQLGDGGAPANGSYDFRFAIYNAVTNGSQTGPPVTNTAVPVSNGLFTVTLNFGPGIFTGSNCWLDIGVRTTGIGNYTALVPRQPVLPVPYAIFSTTASNLSGALSSSQLTGTIPSAQISGTYSNPVNFTNSGNNFSGTFAGNGAALNSLNASQLVSGTVADARLSANVALLDHSQTYTGNNTYNGSNQFNGANNFTNLGNNFTGSFFGNGLVGWITVPSDSVQAAIDTGYMLTSSQFTTVTLPTDTNLLGYIVRISGAGSGGWRVGQGTNQSIIGNFISYKNSAWVQANGGGAATWRCLASSADGSLMYAGSASLTGIFISTDSGHNWGGGGVPAGSSWYGVACSADGSRVFAAPRNANIQYSFNAGNTWTNVAGSSQPWTAIACSADGTRILAAASPGRLWTNGAVWGATGPAGNSNWTAVASSASGINLAATIGGGGIFTSSTGGASWANNSPVNANWTAVVVSADGSKMAAAAFNNSIYLSTNAGASWYKSAAPTNNWTCLAASADCTRLVAGVSNSVLYASVNFGATWNTLGSPTNKAWSAICSSADGSRLAAGVNNSLTGYLYYSSGSAQITTLTSTNGFLSGSQGSAVELQHIGNGRFMPVSSAGVLWAN
jgi:hypothetical protein